MTADKWEELVRRLDVRARRDPAGYRRRVGLLAAAGYGYVFGVLGLLVGLAGGIVWLALATTAAFLKILLPLGAVCLVILRSVWVRVPPPDGIRLSRSDAPELWALVDDLRSRVGGADVHALLLDGELNASIVQVPRLGPLGWERSYLTIGLPLMQALDEPELRAVVAHELGHISHSHGRFSAWIYRVRETWSRLLFAFEHDRHWGQALFRKFFEWYAPYFGAYSFALVRAHEYEADQASADATSPNAAARALVGLVVAARELGENYWPGVYSRVRTENAPPRTAFLPLGPTLAGIRSEERASQWVAEALAERGGTADTHPSLSERLAALGVPPGEEHSLLTAGGGSGGSAASRLLGPAEAELAQTLDAHWRAEIAGAWAEEHERLRADERTLAALDERAGRGETLSLDELRQRAEITAELASLADALPLFEAVLARAPDDASASYALGIAFLAGGDESGLAHLERAMRADPEATIPACLAAYEFLTKQGRAEEAERFRERAERAAATA